VVLLPDASIASIIKAKSMLIFPIRFIMFSPKKYDHALSKLN